MSSYMKHNVAHWDMSDINPQDICWKGEFLKTLLSAHYKMNDNAATSVVVDSISGNNGTYSDSGGAINTATGSVAGKINTALDLDGGDEFISVPDLAAINPLMTEFAAACWVKTSGAGGGTGNDDKVLSKESGGAQWSLRVERATGFVKSVINDGVGAYSAYGTTNIYDGAFHHIGFVWLRDANGGGCRIQIWVDSVMEIETRIPLKGSIITGGLPLYIGRDDTAGVSYFDGVIDDVRIYKRRLDQDDWDALYASDIGTELYGRHHGTHSNLVAATDIVKGIAGGSAIEFDGINQVIAFGNLNDIRTISMWFKPVTNTEELVLLDAGNDIMINAGTITYTGVAASATYINGELTTTGLTGMWNHLVSVLSADFAAADFELATDGANFGAVIIDEVTVFSDILTMGQSVDLFQRQRRGHL